jgi:hypothetical protein
MRGLALVRAKRVRPGNQAVGWLVRLGGLGGRASHPLLCSSWWAWVGLSRNRAAQPGVGLQTYHRRPFKLPQGLESLRARADATTRTSPLGGVPYAWISLRSVAAKLPLLRFISHYCSEKTRPPSDVCDPLVLRPSPSPGFGQPHIV